MIEGYF